MYFPTQFYLHGYMTMKLLIMNINFVGEIDGFTNYNFGFEVKLCRLPT